MRLNKEEPLSHLNTWKNRYKVGDDASLWHCGAHTCVSMFTEFILKIIFCSQPPPSLTLQLCSSHAIHFLWLISCLLSLPVSNLPHQSGTITKSILGQMLWTDPQRMQDYSRSKSLLFGLLVPLVSWIFPMPSFTFLRQCLWRNARISPISGFKSGFRFPSSGHLSCFSVGGPSRPSWLWHLFGTPWGRPLLIRPRGQALLTQSKAWPRLKPQA